MTRTLILISLLPLISLDAQHQTALLKPSSRYNVLFIAIDDLRPELNCYGQGHIHSPNIDQLAAEGLLLERAYCQQSVCSPSRISLMTGLRPDSTYVHDNATHHRRTVPEVITLPQHFIQQGYYAVDFGKIYHGHMGAFNDALSWSELWYYPPQNYSENLRGYRSEENQRILAEHRRNPDGLVNFSAKATEGEPVADEAYPDGLTVQAAVEALPRLKDQDQPFFLAVGIEKPHLPFVAPQKYWDLYDRQKIALPQQNTPPTNAPALAAINWGELRGYADIPERGELEEAQAKELIHGYYACVSYADALVGKLLAGLRENGLYDNTIVILWGDHGWKLGDYGDWCKLTNYEIDTRVPLVIRTPDMLKRGITSSALVELVDIYPTLSELAGLPLPGHLQGDSFAPLLTEPNRPWKQAVFSQFPRGAQETGEGSWEEKQYMGYSMRTDRYRYTQWIRWDNKEIVAQELYDHRQDAQETVNVFGQAAYQSVADSLSRAFGKNLTAAHRQGSARQKVE